MSKLKKFIVCAFAVLMLCGCYSHVEKAEEQNPESASMFVLLEQSGSWVVVYHRETKVMYAVSASTSNYGTFTLLVNADGTPMVYEG